MAPQRLRTSVPASSGFQQAEFNAPVVNDPQSAAPASIANSVLEAINASNNIHSGDGKLTTIDVVPDQRFLLISWIYSVSRVIPHTAYLSSPLASPASLIGYTLFMFYGFLFHCDLSLRHGQSIHARLIADDYSFSSLYNRLLDFPVPDFAHNEFASNMPFLPDGTPNLVFVSSLALSSFFHDFGRLFPVTIFFGLHNLMASLPGNTATGNLRNMFYRLRIMSVTIDGNNVPLTPAHFLGRLINEQAYSNWLNIRVDQLVNAMAIRVSNQMAQIGQIPFPAAALADLDAADFITFYNAFTGLDQAHVATIEAAMLSLAPWIRSVLPRSRPLRDYLRAGSNAISDHLSFVAPLPTWSTFTVDEAPEPLVPGQFAPNIAPRTPTQVAQTCHFLVPPTALPNAADDARNILELEVIPAFPAANAHAALWSNAARPDPLPLDIHWAAYSDAANYAPNASIISIVLTTRDSLGHTLISGHVIETFDLLSGTVQFPRSDISFYVQNSQFLSGAIPLRHVESALFDAAHRWHMQTVLNPIEDSTPQVFFRGYSFRPRVPWFPTGLVEMTSHVASQLRSLPGVKLVFNALRSAPATNVYGTSPGYGSHIPPEVRFRLWSSYRFVVPTLLPPSANEIGRIYMLPSLRHLAGTMNQIKGTEHPSRRIPL